MKKKISSPQIFTVWSDEIESRLDPFFYQAYFRELEKELRSTKHDLVKLKDVCVAVRGVTYSREDEAEIGIKVLRANNITLATNEINLDDVRNISADFPVSEEQRLKAGDILMSAASGSKEHVGKVAYIAENTDFYFGSFMMVLRTDTNKISSQYLFEFLSSKIFRGLLFRILGGTNINNLNYSMIEDFEIPLPSPTVQTEIAKIAKKNRAKVKELEQEARKIIASFDSFVFGELGIEMPEGGAEQVYEIWSDEVVGRIDPHFYHPSFKAIERAIQTKNNFALGELVEFSSESWNQNSIFADTFPYIEISAIDLKTGDIAEVEQIPIADAPSRAKMVVRKGDIIVSTTRPNRGAIAEIKEEQDGSIASTGFAVLRDIKTDKISKEFLFIILRSILSLKQMEQRTTGGNYPAITIEDLKQIRIVVPDKVKQEKITSGVQSSYSKMRTLRAQAAEVLESTQKQVAQMILA